MSDPRKLVRLADYVFHTLAEHGVRHAFVVTGGGAMHLNDAIGREKRIKFVCCHHEQACAMAAESYYRVTGRMAVVNVTTGPGGTNAITGVYGAYVDSMAMVVISGQVKWETLVRSTDLPLRQLGDQEVDIVPMVKGVTKYAVVVNDADSIRYHLERALFLAAHGRPGPVWLDIPINLQAKQIDPSALRAYDPAEDRLAFDLGGLRQELSGVVARMKAAKRPVIYAGTGIRLSGQYDAFLRLADRLGVPVVTAWNSNDLLPDAHPAYAGRPGSIGNRAGNFTVQNSDFVLILGSRLNIRLVSYNWENFARHAYKVGLDIDSSELRKPTLKLDQAIHADLRDAIPLLLELTDHWQPAHGDWLAWCKERVARFPVVLKEYWALSDKVNPYCFMDRLFAQLKENEMVACGDGTACVTAFQAATIRSGQRLFHNSGCASMGYDLPAAIGVAIAKPDLARVICLAGDGSVMMNLQELQTIIGQKLPIKLFILNNSGYHSIRQTQQNFFRDNIIGCGTDSGLSFPDFGAVASAFGFPFQRCHRHADLDAAITATLSIAGPAICEIMLDLGQAFSPKLSSRKLEDGRMITAPLEDMAPFLSREDLRANMVVPLHRDSETL